MMIRGVVWGVALGALSVLLPGGPAGADELKIAVVDGRRALISSREGKAAEKALRTLMDRKKQEIEPLETDLKRQEEEFESQKFVLSKSAAEERQLELIKRRRDLERRMREAQDDLELEQRRLMQPMLKKVDDALKEIGEDKGFTVILEKSSPGVLYTDESLDITDLVIEKLNQKKK